MEQRSIIIIGAGLAGLSAGCYGRMNGYETRIFEMHNIPGGLCTSWDRKGYTFDGCIHYLFGSRSGPYYKFYEELGVVQGREMVDNEELLRVEGADGRTWIVYADADRFERHTKEMFPDDAEAVGELFEAVRLFTRVTLPVDKPAELMGLFDLPKLFKLLPAMGSIRKYNEISMQDYAKRFKDPFLREAFPEILEDIPDFPMTALLMTLAELHKKNAGWPVGGSLALARAVEQRYVDLGGEVQYKARVEEILVEQDQAVGVRLEDGTEHRADVVISAADGRTTVFEMLGGKYVDDRVRGYYDEWPVFGAFIQISLGVARDLSSEPHWVSIPFEEPLKIGDQTRDWVHVRHFCFDPTMAPAGKSVVLATFLFIDHPYWKQLREDRARYRAEKKALAGAVIDRLETRFPGIKDQIETVDVATPVTYERYTGNWQGSYMGWANNTETSNKMMSRSEMMKRTLPGLGRFYMAGQWVYPGGGVPGAIASGRHLMQVLCKGDRKRFVATVP